jgi:hypothetical protein
VGDDLLELRVECEDLRRRIRVVEKRIAELERIPHAAGAPCVADIALNALPEVCVHDVAPPDDALSLRDEPPSRPA